MRPRIRNLSARVRGFMLRHVWHFSLALVVAYLLMNGVYANRYLLVHYDNSTLTRWISSENGGGEGPLHSGRESTSISGISAAEPAGGVDFKPSALDLHQWSPNSDTLVPQEPQQISDYVDVYRDSLYLPDAHYAPETESIPISRADNGFPQNETQTSPELAPDQGMNIPRTEESSLRNVKENPTSHAFKHRNGSRVLKAGETGKVVFSCYRSHFRADICHMRGDVRVRGGAAVRCMLYTVDHTLEGRQTIRPYPRKWEESTMEKVQLVSLRSEYASATNDNPCEVRHMQPALLFSTGGFSGNVYHDFNDVLIPLFISSHRYGGEVQFLITDYKDWWMRRYSSIISQLSKYEPIDFQADERVHCFNDLKLGLLVHGELEINPRLSTDGQSIQGFQKMLVRAFKNPSGKEDAKLKWKTSGRLNKYECPKPRVKLAILDRLHNRVILNIEEVVDLARERCFNVAILRPTDQNDLTEIFHVVNSADVVLGVHGAALTHILFMRPGAVFIQIIPIGTEEPASEYYGKPAIQMGLRYLPYVVKPEESTLISVHNISDPVITDAETVASESWDFRRITYMESQDVNLELNRFVKCLKYARLLATSPSMPAATGLVWMSSEEYAYFTDGTDT